MNYFIKEQFYSKGRTFKSAASKARLDIENIFLREQFEPIKIEIIPRKGNMNYISTSLKNHFQVMLLWRTAVHNIERGDRLFIQFPLQQHSIFLDFVLKKLIRRGVEIITVIHDLESIRVIKRDDISFFKSYILKKEEFFFLKWSSKLIVHNDAMKSFLIKKGISSSKLIPLQIFDYLIPDYDTQIMKKRFNQMQPIIIAGTLRPHKADYVYHLPTNLNFNLYGAGYVKNDLPNISYKGVFRPNELPNLLEGSFGLVWDGDDIKTCAGIYGEYLKINSPHKLSLYLAAGVPVIVWKEAAVEKFVMLNNCGFAVNSLLEIKSKIDVMSDEEYTGMKKNARNVGRLLRSGLLLKELLNQLG
ncbi:MAG: galactofuranosyltransferase [Liquorilactobacillus ghanensis]|uniref:galactofuranosyltransferase n=1 Tax=Liquorilactobacillus ghanensis TaxID=399370 RepID=UPI0039E799BB